MLATTFICDHCHEHAVPVRSDEDITEVIERLRAGGWQIGVSHAALDGAEDICPYCWVRLDQDTVDHYIAQQQLHADRRWAARAERYGKV